jgi:hypothetical protein
MVTTTEDLKSLVGQCPNGNTTYSIQQGTHNDFDVLNHPGQSVDGDKFIGVPGAIESGAKTIPNQSWSQVGAYWTAPAGAPIIDSYNPNLDCNNPNYMHPNHTCYLSQALYFNDQTYERAYRLSDVTPGKWYYEVQGMQQATVANGGSGYSAEDILAVMGGTGCSGFDGDADDLDAGCGSVKVTKVESVGGKNGIITGVELRALGYSYLPGVRTENTVNTTGTGSGATVSITVGSGTNNVYLAENPTMQKVELGDNRTTCGNPSCAAQYLFHSRSAQNITIQGLTVEKYAVPLDFAPISVNHEGAVGGTADGWIIQNNTVMLNAHIGIYAGFGNGAANGIQILNNTVHDNGEIGISGGAPATAITVSGNEVYSNDAVFVPNGYGCGSIKFGGPSSGNGSLHVQQNNVHNEPNGCGGLWSDVSMGNVMWLNNTVTDISGEGIRIEISGTGPIMVAYNTVTGGGTVGRGGAQIHLVSSSNTTVTGNQVTAAGSNTAIAVSYDGRPCGTPLNHCTTPPNANNVSANTITIPDGTHNYRAGMIDTASGKDTSWEKAGIFNPNTYCVKMLPWTASSWFFGEDGVDGPIGFSVWQSKGQDVGVQLRTCP